MRTIYTIGHSTHPAEYFLQLLRSQRISSVVDVRSIAASRFNPQYNKKNLAEFLSKHQIIYIHMPEEFGARQNKPELLDEEGRVSFEKVWSGQAFRSGIERLGKGVDKGYRIALMCAESDPLSCHRFSMVSVALKMEGFQVMHILKNKTLRSQEQLEQELISSYVRKFSQLSITEAPASEREKLEAALRWKNREIGFREG